ncbi:unnamed protein product [Thelazia callipaeda]|uniref:Uncharacterized protein n=1 Tax=Thelazia callipaeda TaxID=103827 RepID=A0A0N5CTJ6_THECL|nr:unnamed protein product [Thelazia callipaeda]
MVSRFDLIWNLQVEGREIEKKHAQNRAVLENILSAHIAEYILKENQMQSAELYSEARENAVIVFNTINEFDKFYMELDANNKGVECLRLRNEIIVDFDTVSCYYNTVHIIIGLEFVLVTIEIKMLNLNLNPY